MKKLLILLKVESLLYMRDFFGFFFTFVFPTMMLILYGSIYGNKPSEMFNGLGAMDVSVPAYAGMIVGVTGLMALPLNIATYKQNKIYKRFDATPSGKGRVMLVQFLVNLLMTIAGFGILFIAGNVIYNINIAGSFIPIFAALIVSICSIFSIGFLFTAIANDIRITNLLCYISYFLMIFLSGATMPIETFPKQVQEISKYIPLTHVVKVLQGTFRGSPIEDYQGNLLVLIILLLICTSIGAALFKRKSWN